MSTVSVTVTVSNRTDWLRASFHRAGQRHAVNADRTYFDAAAAAAAAADTHHSVSSRDQSGQRYAADLESDRIDSDCLPLSNFDNESLMTPASAATEHDSRNLHSLSAGDIENACDFAAVPDAAADLNSSFRAVNFQMAQLRAEQLNQQRLFTEQLQTLQHQQQQYQTYVDQMLQLQQLYHHQQQQPRRNPMLGTCTCQ
jgi:hypothetical protein